MTTELMAPVPAAADYSISVDLWQRLEDEIKSVSGRIVAGDELVPEDVSNVRKLKSQVDAYVTSFNKALRDAQMQYRSMVDRRLAELGYGSIEQFVATKRQEQTNGQNTRIAAKMGILQSLTEQLVERTEKLKDTPLAKELLPAFTARFPKVQSGARTNDIADWRPYFNIMAHTIALIDAFFRVPEHADAMLLPIYSKTFRELLAYAQDGKEEHIANIAVCYEEDQSLIEDEKIKRDLKTPFDSVAYIKSLIDDMGDLSDASDAVKTKRSRETWGSIVHTVQLLSNL